MYREQGFCIVLSYGTRKHIACRNVGLLVSSLPVHSVFHRR